MEWISAPDFPQEMGEAVKNLDSAISEIEKVVETLTSIPLNESQATVNFLMFLLKAKKHNTVSQMEPLDKARHDTAAVYAITSLFWGELRHLSSVLQVEF